MLFRSKPEYWVALGAAVSILSLLVAGFSLIYVRRSAKASREQASPPVILNIPSWRGLLRFCPSGFAWCRETVEFSSAGPLDDGHMRRYWESRARERVMEAQPPFCGVHTWQVKVNLLATSATRKDEHA